MRYGTPVSLGRVEDATVMQVARCGFGILGGFFLTVERMLELKKHTL
jgi:hypothetical protein